MDKITHEIRLMNWKPVVEACNSRPKGTTIRQWLAEQGIPVKTYYYWQRQVRQEIYNQMQQPAVPSVEENVNISFAEPAATESAEPMPVENLSFRADAVIQAGKFTIGVSNSASQSLIRKILESASHVS